MPVAPTYPGVYVQEVPSGARTIAGVGTSVAAFIGWTKRGPVNEAVRINNFGDFERNFGGLDASSELSYALKQFFDNGGTQSFVVRVARNAVAAKATLQNGSSDNVLLVESKAQGVEGNNVSLDIDYNTSAPRTTFNLTLTYIPANGSAVQQESFANLSMNKNDLRFVEDVVNAESRLVNVKRSLTLPAWTSGSLFGAELTESSALVDFSTKLSGTANKLRVAVDANDPVDVTINTASLTGDATANLANVCTQIQTQVRAVIADFSCAPGNLDAETENQRILMTSTAASEGSRVWVLPSPVDDASDILGFGEGESVRIDAVGAIRPVEAPAHGSLTTNTIASLPNDSIVAGNQAFQISLDDTPAQVVNLGTPSLTGTIAEKLPVVAEAIETAVRNLRPSDPAYKGFTCEKVSGSNELILKSGTKGAGSGVVVEAVTGDTLAGTLELTDPAVVSVMPSALYLKGGYEENFTDAEALSAYVGSQANREGIYALENVDLFNIMCLPGLNNSGVFASAVKYCRDRRAFLIIDAPRGKTPAEMETLISGSSLPKDDHAAIYYPWTSIVDPLSGRKRTIAPCGTIAGIFSRTDVARGVWKAPAGTETNLNGVVGMEYPLTDVEQGVLNPLGVNCLRQFPVIAGVSWGARTLRGADTLTSEYKYIPIRRLALYLEESLFRGLKWVVFEPNDEPLWAQVRMNVKAFMHNLFRQGAFAGAKPDDAYFVKCDSETTTPTDRNLGIVNVWVGFAPLKPAEFVILNIQQIMSTK